jgi:hypothetical protein
MSDQPENFTQYEPPSQISEARRRRRKHGFFPPTKGDRAALMAEVAERLVANADFYLFSLLSGAVLAAAILLDSPAIYVLAALLAPFMAPVVGLGFATVVGSVRFFLQSLGSLLIGSALVFVTGLIGGWISHLIPDLALTQAHYHVTFSIPDFILLTIGVLLAIYITVKMPKNRSLVASVALAYEIYIPIGLAGFGLTSGIKGLMPEGFILVGMYLAWVIFIGTLFLAFLKIRPFTFFGYLLTAVMLAAALYLLLTNSAFGSAIRTQMGATAQPGNTVVFSTKTLPAATPTPTPEPGVVMTPDGPVTPTFTLPPTETPTATITPKPTPVYALVYSETAESVIIRKAPGGDYLSNLLVNTLVEVLDTQELNGNMWVHVRVATTGQSNDGLEGWISQSLLQTATPIPNW